MANTASCLLLKDGLVKEIADPKKSPAVPLTTEIVVTLFHDAMQKEPGHEWHPEALFLENTCTLPRRLSCPGAPTKANAPGLEKTLVTAESIRTANPNNSEGSMSGTCSWLGPVSDAEKSHTQLDE